MSFHRNEHTPMDRSLWFFMAADQIHLLVGWVPSRSDVASLIRSKLDDVEFFRLGGGCVHRIRE